MSASRPSFDPRRIGVALVLTAVAVGFFLVPVHHLPDIDPTSGPIPLAYVLHIGLSAFAAAVWTWALPGVGVPWLIGLGLVLTGAAEAAQGLPGVLRTPKLSDFGFNAIGVVLGVALMRGLQRRFARSSVSPRSDSADSRSRSELAQRESLGETG